MSIFSKLGALIFAPTDAAGNPRQVINHDAQVWSTEVERIIQVALEGGDLLVYGSLSALNADLDHPAHTGAILIGESIADDGLYMKQGASGSGSWVKIGNVPGQGFVKATNAGVGTANAIAATTPVAVNETQLILLPITAANTASPVTVAFNGGAALTVKTVSGNDVAVGGLTAGSVMLGVVQGGDFRLLSDQASAGIQAAAEAAQVAAEAALAEMREKSVGAFPDNASADAFLTAEGLTKQKGTIYFNTTADVWRYWDGSAWQTFPYAIVADGGVTRAKIGADLSPSIPLNVKEFGAAGDGVTDDGPPIQSAINAVSAAGGGLCYVPPGTYLTSQELSVPSYVHLMGAGMDATKILASSALSETEHTITNAKNDRLSRTDYDVSVRVSDMTVDSNAWNRTSSGSYVGIGSGVCFSTVRNSSIERVRSINGMLHCIDVMASVYLDDGLITSQPDGPSLDVAVVECWAEDPRLDDGITTHNSGRITIEKSTALFDRSTHGEPASNQQGIEADEGSYNVSVVDCCSKGFTKAYQAKGHSTTHPALDIHFERCVAEDCAFGFDIAHNGVPGGQAPFARKVSVRDCSVKNLIPHTVYSSCRIIGVNGYKDVIVDGMQVDDFENGTFTVEDVSGNVSFTNITLLTAINAYAAGDERAIFDVRSTIGATQLTIRNVFSYAAQPRPIARVSSIDTDVRIENITSDGSVGTLPMLFLRNNINAVVQQLSGAGWEGRINITDFNETYDDNIELAPGRRKFMSTSAGGSPEGVVTAPAGTILWNYISGRQYRKDGVGGNTGWIEIA